MCKNGDLLRKLRLARLGKIVRGHWLVRHVSTHVYIADAGTAYVREIEIQEGVKRMLVGGARMSSGFMLNGWIFLRLTWRDSILVRGT